MARGRRRLDLDRLVTFGGRVPRSVGGLIIAMVALTLATRSSDRLWAVLSLDGPLIFVGQVWRLVTWVLPQGDLITLLFAGFMLHWLGRDLVGSWGERRFLQVYFGYAAWSAFWTAVWASLAAAEPWAGPVRSYVGAWPVVNALLVGWGLSRPGAQLNLFGVVPMTGKVFAWLLAAGTVLFALSSREGAGEFAPHLAALALAFLMNAGVTPRTLWLRAKQRWYAAKMKRRARHLRAVPRDDDRPRWMN